MEAKNHTKGSLVNLFMLVTISCQQVKHNQDKLRLFYNQLAEEWTEALPVGNGFLGAIVYGSVEKEHIQINEETLWTGRPHDYSNKGASDYLDKIRGLLFEGKQREATDLAQRVFLSIPIRQMAYQPFGVLYIEFPGHSDYTDYRRELDLTNSVSKTSYKIDNVEYQREIIASYPHRVIAINLLSKKRKEKYYEQT